MTFCQEQWEIFSQCCLIKMNDKQEEFKTASPLRPNIHVTHAFSFSAVSFHLRPKWLFMRILAKTGIFIHIIIIITIIIINLFVIVINNEILIEHPHCIAMVTVCKVLQSSHSYFVVLCNVCLRIWAEWGEIVCLVASLPLGTGCWPVWLF